MTVRPQVIHSKWCVKCYLKEGKKVCAVFTYDGKSVCEDCLKI